MKDGDRSVVGDSASSAVWTLASRVTGFGRVLLAGAVLGPTFVGNLFQLANQLPWLVFEITVGSLLGSLLVPALMAHIRGTVGGTDLAAVSRLAGGFATTVSLGFLAVSLGVMALSPLIARLFALGVPDEVHADMVRAAVPLVLLTAPQLVGYGLTVTFQSVQQALGSYALPAAAGIIENVVVIGTLIAYGIVFESNTAIVALDTPRMLVLGLGSSLGVTLHVVVQFIGVSRLGVRVRPTAGWRQPEIRAVMSRAGQALGTAALNGFRILALLILANSVAGGVVALQLGLNLVGVAVALGAKPVAYAVLPRLAVRFRSHDLAGYRNEYERGVGLAALIAIPAAGGAALLGWLVGPALAFGAMASDDGRQLLAVTVTGIAGAVVGETLHQLAVAGSYGREDVRSPLVAFFLRLVFTAAILPAALILDGPARVFVIALAMSFGDVVSGALLHQWVGRPLPRPSADDYRLPRSLLRTLAAAAVGFGTAAVLAAGLTQVASGRAFELLVIAVVGALGLGLTLGLRSRLDDEVSGLMVQLRGGAT